MKDIVKDIVRDIVRDISTAAVTAIVFANLDCRQCHGASHRGEARPCVAR